MRKSNLFFQTASLDNQLQTLDHRSNFYVSSTTNEEPTEDEAEDAVSIKNQPSANFQLFSQFLESTNPIDGEEWEESGLCGKICAVLKVVPNNILSGFKSQCVKRSLSFWF